MSNEYEKFIQQHIFDNLWLLDPSWTELLDPVAWEETVNLLFAKLSDQSGKEERTGRIDIRYLTVSGINVIVELKRPKSAQGECVQTV